jgi:hypothetical protein
MLARIASIRVEFFVALLLVVFALVEMFGALELSMSEEFTIGPGAMPLIYSAGLLLFAGALLYSDWRKHRAQPAAEASPSKVAEEEEKGHPTVDYAAGVKTFLLVTGFIAAIYFVGFLISIAVFAFLHLKFVMRMPLLKAAIIGLIWGGALYYAFAHLLEVQLEPGILFSGS